MTSPTTSPDGPSLSEDPETHALAPAGPEAPASPATPASGGAGSETVAVPTTRGLLRVGLRARLTLAFAFGALAISVLLGVATLGLTRYTLIRGRETRVQESVVTNSEVFAGANVDDRALRNRMGSVSPAGAPVLYLMKGTDVLALSLDATVTAGIIPKEARDQVLRKSTPTVQRFRTSSGAYLAVGIPLRGVSGAYFEVARLGDIEQTVRTMAYALLIAGTTTTLLGAGLGYWASRRMLKPITDISAAAESIAAGHLETRLQPEHYSSDVDLGPLVTSFNTMIGNLQDRIDRDARFASDVSHELRSPLTTINASLGVLDNARSELPDRAVTALDLLTSDLARFTQLVEDLLEISRFDAGAVKLELEEVLLVDMVRSTVSAVARKRVPVVVDERLIGRVVEVDRRRVARILANFLDNADKYGGGASLVSVERQEREVLIAVEDEGAGIPVEDRQRIFDRFSRGTQGGSRVNDSGVGLGLALAAEHARLQDGRVWVEAHDDGTPGARFVLALPLVRQRRRHRDER